MSHNEHGNFTLLFTLFPNLRIVETESDWLEISETENSEIPRINTSDPVVLSGFFQNSNNIPRNIPPLQFQPRKAWAIHFRFGDYCFLPHHQIPGIDRYYYQAIRNIPSGSTIVLFSDSPERLPKISQELETIYKVEIYTNLDTLETLKAFAGCQEGSVCGNSTFAWWAAYYASQANHQYRAYFPDKWLNNPANLPFTQLLDIENLPAFPVLSSFSFS